jgi:[ribosomal protein S18]-alanine N-acetyltransferase
MTNQPATQTDVDRLVALHSKGFETGWDRQSIADFIERDLVLVRGDPLAGFIIARQSLDEAEILTLVVDPRARRGRHGFALVTETLEKLEQGGVTKVFLEVAFDNQAAISLYLRAGFMQIGVRKAYYARGNGPPMDALVLSANLPPPANCS